MNRKLSNKRLSTLTLTLILALTLAKGNDALPQPSKTSPKSKTTQTKRKKSKKHEKKIFLKYNPHLYMFKGNELDTDVCLLCHMVKHSSNPKETGKRKYLTDKPNNICGWCHGTNPHPGALTHSGKVKRNMIKRIKTWQKKTGKTLRLDKGYVTCSTCHSPHPAGVLKALSPEIYKDVKAYFGISKFPGKKRSILDKPNEKKIAQLKIGKKTEFKVNSQKLPFREDLTDGKFCKICHDLR